MLAHDLEVAVCSDLIGHHRREVAQVIGHIVFGKRNTRDQRAFKRFSGDVLKRTDDLHRAPERKQVRSLMRRVVAKFNLHVNVLSDISD